MEEKYCQSCGMPMNTVETVYGTNADGSKNEDYCAYCFENGAYKQDCTMEEMIEFCLPHVVSFNSDMSEEEAKKMMREFFPKLKRWKTA